jgi:formate/nitrite transporter FocA (FNT family)
MPRDTAQDKAAVLDREPPKDEDARIAVQAGGDDAAAQQPNAIWAQGVEEGARRLDRRPLGEAATGLIGGVDVMLGVAATAVVAGALTSAMPADAAAVLGALVFGIGFVFITIGRSELFSENFLIPVGAVFEGRRPVSLLARTWAITLATNILGLFLMGLVFSTGTVLHHSAIQAAGHTADVFAARSPGAAFLSAVAAGMVMTLWTWLSTAARTDIGRITIALVVGFTIAAPTMNHVIVGTGEMMFGVLGGATHATWGDVWANFGLALAGNLVGGMGFVTVTRFVQARGEDGGAARR